MIYVFCMDYTYASRGGNTKKSPNLPKMVIFRIFSGVCCADIDGVFADSLSHGRVPMTHTLGYQAEMKLPDQIYSPHDILLDMQK